MEKIKVCHICNLGMNGKAVFLCNLLENTDYNRYEVTIINYRRENAEPVISRLEKLTVKIVNPPEGSELAFCRFLDRYFKANRFDVCHSHIWDQSGLFLAVAHRNGIPVRVAHSHNTSKVGNRYGNLKTFVRDKVIWNLFLQMIKAHANRYVGRSEEAARWLFVKPIIDAKKYTVIPNGIDIKKFAYPERTVHHPTEVLFAGKFVYQKNPIFAVEAFAEFRKNSHDAHMTMIGKGEMDAEVRSKIAELGLMDSVTIVPETSEMPKYYKAADLLLLPSHYEGLAITLIEAQASGLKCLSSDTVSKEAQCGLIDYKPLNVGASTWGGVHYKPAA